MDKSSFLQDFLKRNHPKHKHLKQHEQIEIDQAKVAEMEALAALESKYDSIRRKKANRRRKAEKKYHQ